MEHAGRRPTKLPRGKGIVHTVHMAATNIKYFVGPDLHAKRPHDPDCHADWAASTLARAGLCKVSDRASGRRVEGSGEDVGSLQCHSAEVS